MDGRCFALRGSCVARSDEACLSSLACRETGRCMASGGRCVTTKIYRARAAAGSSRWQ